MPKKQRHIPHALHRLTDTKEYLLQLSGIEKIRTYKQERKEITYRDIANKALLKLGKGFLLAMQSTL